jgi:hypothetical protein
VLQRQLLNAGALKRHALSPRGLRQPPGQCGWIDDMRRVGEKYPAGHGRERRLELRDLRGGQPFLPDTQFVAQPGAPVAAPRRHLFKIDIEAAVMAKQIGDPGLFGQLAPGGY